MMVVGLAALVVVSVAGVRLGSVSLSWHQLIVLC